MVHSQGYGARSQVALGRGYRPSQRRATHIRLLASFLGGSYQFFSSWYFRTVGVQPVLGTKARTSTINETIDGSVFDGWRSPRTSWSGRNASSIRAQ
ncbi:hypothetical protein MES5069_800016 [Mesorhizobium escarrei]|uniref:Uncharacterized protein n=1 Tax=Mesorhizobium escarrei TaxID=666018 RepID=A0ABM9EIW1_9HYPH|nr:hypothetical protein MES5069_800016 [Mesorhizobium escarrei]